MQNCIDLDQPVAKILALHPEVKDLLIDLGFTPLANPLMVQTVGRKTSLRQGAKLIKVPLETIEHTLLCNGYQVLGGTSDVQ